MQSIPGLPDFTLNQTSWQMHQLTVQFIEAQQGNQYYGNSLIMEVYFLEGKKSGR
jgi:hypothetical protein